MNSGKAKVMVIDDELGTRESLRMLLKNNYDVIVQEDPIKALEYLSSHPVDVVISDIRMPQMSGIELLKKIKEISPSIEVIMVTAYASVTTVQEAWQSEAAGYMTKPFSKNGVETAIQRALDHQSRKSSGDDSIQQVKNLMEQLRNLSTENQRLNELSVPKGTQLNSKAMTLSIVQTISKAVLKNLDSREVLKSVIDQIQNGLGYDNIIFFLLNEREQTLDGVWKNDALGNIRDASDQRLPLSAAPSAIELTHQKEIGDGLSCPIIVDEKLVGLMHLDNRLSRKKIDAVELELISMLAEYITIAIKNAQQYRALEERTAEMISTNEQLQAEITARLQAEKALQEANLHLEDTLAELRATQKQNVQQERLRAIGQMASGIAHDFNNALTPILGFSELLLNRPENMEDREKTTRFLQMMRTAAQDAANAVHRLREFYRVRGRGEIFRPVDLNQLVEGAIMLTQPRWKDQTQGQGILIRMETDLLQPVPAIAGSESNLRDALTNLIFNAVDAMPKGGTITIRTRIDSDHVLLEVSDTGVGMTEEVRQRCLEPFFSTKGEQGSGFGLALVYGILQRHEGTIDVESELGAGSTFRIRLPIQTEHAPDAELRSARQAATGQRSGVKPPSRSLRVLVVEDEPMIHQMLTTYLTSYGHTTEVATNGTEGLEKFQASQFDVVVTDRAMPEMGGDQLAAAIKEIMPNVPVIMLTGFGDLMNAVDEKPAGVDMILSKPVGLTEFRAALEKLGG
ncbi:response regulator [Candidatus Poribacteria bacterium]|nr:response regulator [Candidatus Poribacteria bacterium]